MTETCVGILSLDRDGRTQMLFAKNPTQFDAMLIELWTKWCIEFNFSFMGIRI